MQAKDFLKRLALKAESTSGNVTIELAVVMSVFALLAMGGFDVSRMAKESHEMEQIARSAAQWALLNQGAAADTEEIEQKAIEAAGEHADDITANAENVCICPESGSEVDCDVGSCPGDEVSQLYVEVTITKPFVFLFDVGLAGDFTLEGFTRMRVR